MASFDDAERLLKRAREEHEHLEAVNVRMNEDRARIADEIERERVVYQAKVQAAQILHDARLGKLSRRFEAKRLKLEDRRDDLGGLVEENEVRQQRLRPEVNDDHGMHLRAATSVSERRTSRSSLAVPQPVLEDEAVVSAHTGMYSAGHDPFEPEANDQTQGEDGVPETDTALSVNIDATEARDEASSQRTEHDTHRARTFAPRTPGRRRTRFAAPPTTLRLLAQGSPPSESGEDAWLFDPLPTVTPSRTRAVKIPNVPTCDPIPPTDYDDPVDVRSLSPQFSLVISLNGEWHEMACSVCGANAPQDRSSPGFFNGLESLRSHIRQSHGVQAAELESLIVRTFDWDDVGRLLGGLHPLSGAIVQKRSEKKSRGSGGKRIVSGGTSTTQNDGDGGDDDASARAALDAGGMEGMATQNSDEIAVSSPFTPGGPPAGYKPPMAQM